MSGFTAGDRVTWVEWESEGEPWIRADTVWVVVNGELDGGALKIKCLDPPEEVQREYESNEYGAFATDALAEDLRRVEPELEPEPAEEGVPPDALSTTSTRQLGPPGGTKGVLRTLHDVIGSPQYASVLEEVPAAEKIVAESRERRAALVQRGYLSGAYIDRFDEEAALAMLLYLKASPAAAAGGNGIPGIDDIPSEVNRLCRGSGHSRPLQRLVYSWYRGFTTFAAIEQELRPAPADAWMGYATIPQEYKKGPGETISLDGVTVCTASKAVAEHFVEWGRHSGSAGLVRVVSRPADASGFHAPIEVPSELTPYPGEHEAWLPPLTNALVLSSDWNSSASRLEVSVDVTYVPQLFSEALLPPGAVWAELADGGVAALSKWLRDTPVANLETAHTEFGCTMLYSAARFGNLDAARLLVARCAHIDSQLSRAQSTALHAASYFGHEEIVSFLLDHHADYTLKNTHGLTALEEASPECAAIFREHPWTASTDGTSAAAVGSSGRFCAQTLVYGERSHFMKNISEYIGPCPGSDGRGHIDHSILMAAVKREFSRNLKWTDRFATTEEHKDGYAPDHYSAPEQWRTACGVLDELRSKPEAAGLHDVFLVALRLYTMPAYAPVNTFLRAVCMAEPAARAPMLAPDSTWAAFAWAILQGFAALGPGLHTGGTPDPMPDVYRGIDMPLAPEFFIPDERGMMSAMEYAFTSSSLKPGVADGFAATGGAAVKFHIHQCVCDAAGFHSGIELDWISPFPEAEVLFPPFTLFRVMSMKRTGHLVTLEVCPTWTAWESGPMDEYLEARPVSCSSSYGPESPFSGQGSLDVKLEPLTSADCNTHMGWESAGMTENQWITFEFPRAVNLSAVGIAQSTGRSGYNAKLIRTLCVQCTSGLVDWQTMYQVELLRASAERPKSEVAIANIEIPASARRTLTKVRLLFVDGWGERERGTWLSVAKVNFGGRVA